jgi:hypothetical protein
LEGDCCGKCQLQESQHYRRDLTYFGLGSRTVHKSELEQIGAW